MQPALQDGCGPAVQDQQPHHDVVDPSPRHEIAASIGLVGPWNDLNDLSHCKHVGEVLATNAEEPVVAEDHPEPAQGHLD